jgi:hypothetical protein
MHRAVRIGIAKLPVHPQYIDAGTLYYAELREPLTFGVGIAMGFAVRSHTLGILMSAYG